MRVVYGDPEEVQATVGAHTASVERTNLTSRQMNGRLVRKTLSFSKELRLLEAASCWEDAVYNFTRPMKTLRVEQEEHAGSTRWRQRTPAMAAGLDFSCLDRPGAFNLRACSFFYHYLIGRLPSITTFLFLPLPAAGSCRGAASLSYHTQPSIIPGLRCGSPIVSSSIRKQGSANQKVDPSLGRLSTSIWP